MREAVVMYPKSVDKFASRVVELEQCARDDAAYRGKDLLCFFVSESVHPTAATTGTTVGLGYLLGWMQACETLELPRELMHLRNRAVCTQLRMVRF